MADVSRPGPRTLRVRSNDSRLLVRTTGVGAAQSLAPTLPPGPPARKAKRGGAAAARLRMSSVEHPPGRPRSRKS